MSIKIGRNDPCPFGSEKKYKNCCYQKDIKIAQPEKIKATFTIDDDTKLIRPIRSLDLLSTHNSEGFR